MLGEFALLHWRCLGQDACHDMMKHAAARNKAADRASMWLVAPPRNLRRTLKIEKTQIPEFPSDIQIRKNQIPKCSVDTDTDTDTDTDIDADADISYLIFRTSFSYSIFHVHSSYSIFQIHICADIYACLQTIL